MFTWIFFLGIDECPVENSCDANAICTKTEGSYNCECNAGYTGDGFSCSGKIVVIIYILSKKMWDLQ